MYRRILNYLFLSGFLCFVSACSNSEQQGPSTEVEAAAETPEREKEKEREEEEEEEEGEEDEA